MENFYADVRCTAAEGTLISTAGMSEAALRLAAKHSDRHALWGMPLAETKAFVDRIRRYCEEAGRAEMPEIQMQFRPLLGDTHEDARKRAADIMERMRNQLGGWAAGRTPETAGATHALEVLERGEWHDSCFWAGPVAEGSGSGNNTALVGSAEELRDALCEYHTLGISVFGLNDYDTLEGAVNFGKSVIPMVKQELNSDVRR